MKEKVEYCTIHIDATESMSWVYSAVDFQEVLDQALKGQTLKNVLVSLYGYLDSCKREKNFFDFSYMGGTLLIVAENTVLELVIHALGMMEYRILYE